MKALKPLFIGGVIVAAPFVAMHGASATHASWDVTKGCQGNQVVFTVHVTNSYTETLDFHYMATGGFFGSMQVAPGLTKSASAGSLSAAKDTTYTVGLDGSTQFIPDGAKPVGLTPAQWHFDIHQGECGFVVPTTTTTTSPPPTAIIGTPTTIVPAPTVATTAAQPTPTASSVTPETASPRQSPPRRRVAVPVTLPRGCLVQSHCSATANGDAGIFSVPIDGHGNPHGVLLAGVAVVAVSLVLALARHGRSDTTAS